MIAVSASAIVSDADGVGTVGFGVAPTYESTAAAAADCEAVRSCVVRAGPHGEVVTVLSHVDRPGGYQLVNVRVYMGQTVVFVSASNGYVSYVSPGTGAVTMDDSTVGRPDLPLSVDELIDIAAAPELTLFPDRSSVVRAGL